MNTIRDLFYFLSKNTLDILLKMTIISWESFPRPPSLPANGTCLQVCTPLHSRKSQFVLVAAFSVHSLENND